MARDVCCRAEEQGGVYVACAEQLFDILDEFSELVLANLDALYVSVARTPLCF